MKREIKSINLILIIFLTGLLSCTVNKSDSSTNSDSTIVPAGNTELLNVLDTCGIDSVLSNADYLFSNQDTVTLIKREQLLYPLDMSIRKILKNHRYGNYFYVSSHPQLKIIKNREAK